MNDGCAWSAQEGRNAKRVRPRTYWVETDKGVHGTKDLSHAAGYTASFANALCDIWCVAFEKHKLASTC